MSDVASIDSDDTSIASNLEAGEDSNSFEGRVITVKCGDYTQRISIDATGDAIKEAIRTAFSLRPGRGFWLEDEYDIARPIDRDMPLGNYTLHVDEGLTIKVYSYEEADSFPPEDITFYTEKEFGDFLAQRGWARLREYNGYRNVDMIYELRHGAIYLGISK